LFIMKKCKMSISCRAAEFVTNEMLASSRQETEYRLDVFHTANGAKIDIY
jgi:hypothetical protein